MEPFTEEQLGLLLMYMADRGWVDLSIREDGEFMVKLTEAGQVARLSGVTGGEMDADFEEWLDKLELPVQEES